MNQDPVIKVFMKLGITETDSKVYIYLIKGITNTILKSSTRFSAIPFEKVLDIIIKTKKQEAKIIQKKETQVSLTWHLLFWATQLLKTKTKTE